MSVVAIWNPASGSAPEESELQDALGREVRLVPTTESDPGPGQAREAVENGVKTLIACGGDGTVRACLEPLTGSATALGIVPLGTGNLLASNLGLESGLAGAAGIEDMPTREIDVGVVNGESFAVMAGSGFDALMIERANSDAKSRFGTIAYVLSGLKSLREPRVSTTVTVDGEAWFTGATSMVLVGNFGGITGGIEMFPDAQPDDGHLDVMTVTSRGAMDWIRFGLSTLLGKEIPELAQRTRGARIVVQHSEERIYELDGEERSPAERLEFVVRPAAISVHYQENLQ